MIRCVNVHKSYRMHEREVQALRGVDLHVDKPGFFAIMGQSGSGKSTLLHLLGGLDRPDSGEVRVNGQPLHEMSERELTLFRRKHIGIVFQQFNLIPTLTAKENVELPGMLAADDPAFLRQTRSMELLEKLGVARTCRPPARCRSAAGARQRVAIAPGLALLAPRASRR